MSAGPAAKEGQGRGTRALLDWLEARFSLTDIFSMLTGFGLFPAELDSRRPLREALREAFDRPLPSYARWPRVLGILSILLFAFLVLTGAMLAFYYQPGAAEAYGSVTTIVRDVSFGWFVHQMHRWGSYLLLVILLVRIGRFYFQGLYKAPREGLWILAVLTFLAALHADFTGRLLGWNADGYWTSVRAAEVIAALPVLGPMFAFLTGSETIDALVLTRFYFLHIFIVPAALLVLFYLHFSGVRRVGLSALPEQRRAGAAVYTVYLYNLLILAVVTLGCLVTLAMVLPEPFLQAADPLATPAGARPPWYLLASHAVLETLPSIVPRPVRGLLVLAILAAVILVPFIDRSPGRAPRERKGAIAAGAVVVFLWLLFTWIGYRLESPR